MPIRDTTGICVNIRALSDPTGPDHGRLSVDCLMYALALTVPAMPMENKTMMFVMSAGALAFSAQHQQPGDTLHILQPCLDCKPDIPCISN